MRTMALLLVAMTATILNAGDVETVKERLKNDPYMIPFYTGKILPTPQKVTYHESFVPLENTGVLLGKGLAENDARLKLLLDRVTKYGGEYKFVDSLDNDCTAVFAVGDTEFSENLAIPDKPQAYAIKCIEQDGKTIVVFDAEDRLGLTWAVNTLVQMITLRDDQTVLHTVDVQDFPFIVKRGTKGPGDRDYVAASRIYPVIAKLDWILYTKSLLVPRRAAPISWIDWRPPRPPELTNKVALIGDNLKGLGIEWQVGIMPFTIGNGIKELIQLDCKGDEHFDIVWNLCKPVLKAGGGVCYTPDDYRFPISEADKKNFGTAREADVYFIKRLYSKMKNNYPEATMSMVQPFYWGPGTTNPWSEESPIEYLKAIGERLPKDIGIAWTGPSVKTAGFDAQDAAKMAALIKRKPYFAQNSSDFYHNYRYIYPTDVISWWLNNGRDKNVYKSVNGAIYNSGGLYPDMLWSAMLWNPDGYNAEVAAYQATCKLIGPENYELATNLVEAMAYFDQFQNLKQTPFAARHFEEIKNKFAEAEKLLHEYENNEHHPAAVKEWASLSWPLRHIRLFCNRLEENDSLRKFVSQGAMTEKRAKQEAALNAETDQLFTAYNFEGGREPKTIFGRQATWVNGQQSKYHTMSFKFKLEHYPPETDYALMVCGRDGGKENACAIEIMLNGKPVFSGPNPLSRNEWSLHTFPIPIKALKRYNTMTIRNTEDTGSSAPYFALNYAVIRKLEQSKKGKQE